MRRRTWVEVGRQHTPTPSRGIKTTSLSEDMMKVAMFGITTVEMKCNETGEIRFVTTPGDQT